MLSLLFTLLFASEPKLINLDFKLHRDGKTTPIQVELESGKKADIIAKKSDLKFTIEPNIVDQDEVHIKVDIEELKSKRSVASSEIITFDQVSAEVETDNDPKSSVRLELTPDIL